MLGMTVDARADETLSANRLNGCFQSQLRTEVFGNLTPTVNVSFSSCAKFQIDVEISHSFST